MQVFLREDMQAVSGRGKCRGRQKEMETIDLLWSQEHPIEEKEDTTDPLLRRFILI